MVYKFKFSVEVETEAGVCYDKEIVIPVEAEGLPSATRAFTAAMTMCASSAVSNDAMLDKLVSHCIDMNDRLVQLAETVDELETLGSDY